MHKNLILVVLVGSNKVCLNAWFGKFTLNVMKDAQFVFKFLDSNPFYETFAACTLQTCTLIFNSLLLYIQCSVLDIFLTCLMFCHVWPICVLYVIFVTEFCETKYKSLVMCIYLCLWKGLG